MKTKKDLPDKEENTTTDQPKTILGAIHYRVVSDVLDHGVQLPLQRLTRLAGVFMLILVLSFPGQVATAMAAFAGLGEGRLQTFLILSLIALFWTKLRAAAKWIYTRILDESRRIRTIQTTGHRFEGIPVRDLIDFLLSREPFGRDVFEFLFGEEVERPRDVHEKIKDYLLDQGILVRARERDNAILLNPEIRETGLIQFFRDKIAVQSRGEEACPLPSFTIRTISGDIMGEPHSQAAANRLQTE